MVTGASAPRRQVMAIVNITDNSFSHDGILAHGSWPDALATACATAVNEGAQILDLGAQASFAGAPTIAEDDEVYRVRGAVEVAVGAVGGTARISVDSHRSRVVATAFEGGASIANSIWGIRQPDGGWNDELVAIVRSEGGHIVLSSNRSAQATISPLGPQWIAPAYADLRRDVMVDLAQQIGRAVDLGLDPAQLIIDPGLGLGKAPEQSLEVLAHFDQFCALGLPTLLAASRKVFLALSTARPPAERDHASVAATTLAAQAGASYFRVHNVRATVDALAVVDSLDQVRARPSSD